MVLRHNSIHMYIHTYVCTSVMYTCTYTICGVSLLRLQGCAIKLIKTRLALICVYKTLPKWEIKKLPICRKVAVKWIAYNDKVTPKSATQ